MVLPELRGGSPSPFGSYAYSLGLCSVSTDVQHIADKIQRTSLLRNILSSFSVDLDLLCSWQCLRVAFVTAGISDEPSETIVIRNVTRYSDDLYECVASNGVPPAAVRHIRVTVECQFALSSYSYVVHFSYTVAWVGFIHGLGWVELGQEIWTHVHCTVVNFFNV